MIRLLFVVFLFIVVQLAASFFESKRVRLYGTIAVTVLFVVLGALSAFYTTSDQEIGFVNRFGINTPIEKTGLKVKTPFFSKAYIYPGITQSMTIGYIEEAEDKNEYTENPEESLMITSDFNFIEVDAYIEYQIVDPIAFHFATFDPVGILKNAALTALKNNVGLTDVDSVITTGRAQLEANITDTIIGELESHNTGLKLVKVSIQDVSQPTEKVKAAFAKVSDAKQKAEEKINEARKYRNQQIPGAEAEAARIIATAEAVRTERVNEATAEVSKFEALWQQFQSSDVVREKLYYDTLTQILPGMDIIISPDGKTVFVKGNNSDIATAGTAEVSQ